MRTILALILALAALVGCRELDSDEPEFDCICGTPEGAIELCLHPACVAGETNPDNHECACGAMSLDD